jgi:hypothetical protein
MFSSFCIQSFRERVEEREKERGKGWRNNRGRNAAAAAGGGIYKGRVKGIWRGIQKNYSLKAGCFY